MGGVSNRSDAERALRDAADGDDTAPLRERSEEREAGLDLGAFRRSVRRHRSRVRRHDVPEEDVVLDPELAQDAMDDSGGRLRGAGARELALRGERDPRDASAAIAGGLPHEEDRRRRTAFQVAREPRPEERRAGAVRVLVERAPDPRSGQLVDECLRRYD